MKFTYKMWFYDFTLGILEEVRIFYRPRKLRLPDIAYICSRYVHQIDARLLSHKKIIQVSHILPDSPCHHPIDRKSTRLNSSHSGESRMPSSA